MHYLVPDPEALTPDSVKALVLIGSMGAEPLTEYRSHSMLNSSSAASFKPAFGGLQYTASKHAVLGLQRAIGPVCTSKGIRSGSVNPGFAGWHANTALFANALTKHSSSAIDTPLVKVPREKGLLAGIPLVPIERVAATCLAVATDTNPETSERPWLLLDGVDVERLHNFDLDEGLYKELNIRTKYSLRPAKPFTVPAKPQ
jgi:NAD(P)-dependent dehydrogenase (short-subunit alcohol dehydrogenase family)